MAICKMEFVYENKPNTQQDECIELKEHCNMNTPCTRLRIVKFNHAFNATKVSYNVHRS